MFSGTRKEKEQCENLLSSALTLLNTASLPSLSIILLNYSFLALNCAAEISFKIVELSKSPNQKKHCIDPDVRHAQAVALSAAQVLRAVQSSLHN